MALKPLLLVMFAGAPPSDVPFALAGEPSTAIESLHRFASANDDWVNDLVVLGNGEVIAVGFLNRGDGPPPTDWHALAAELSPSGGLIKQHSYGEGQGIDAFWSVAGDSEGRRMYAGFTTRIGNGGIDALTLLTDARGSVLAERAFGGAGYDRFTDIARVSDGYVFLGHSQLPDSDKRSIFVVKTDFAGQPLWERVHDAPESWGALYIEPIAGGNFIVAGGTTLGDDGDMFAMKIDAEGRELWRKRVGTPEWDEVNHGLVVRPDGRIVLVGYTHRRGEESNDLVATTLSPEGDLQRLERLGGTADDRAILAKPDASGRIWVVGHTASSGAGGADLLLARLDRDGQFDPAVLTIGTTKDDKGTAVLPLADGSLLLAGYSEGLGGGAEDAFVLKLSAPKWDLPNAAFKREVAKP